VGNLSACAELHHSSFTCQLSPEGRNDFNAALCCLAALFDVTERPQVLGRQLRRAIELLDCADEVTLLDREADKEPFSDPQAVSLRLDQGVGKHHWLTAIVSDDPREALLLTQVLRIGRAAIALNKYRQEERNRAALWPAAPIEVEAGAVFASEQTQELLALARRVANAEIPVLITGETGTGKEVLARLVHAYSARAKGTFMPFNCTATPKEMLDSQLFGHRRGAFTGATDHFQGVIRAAAGGTLFLDEIGETTLDVQPKLLRFLESSEVHPIGETHPARVDVRIIAATNADLETLIADGRFREDLYYRLNTIRLHIPPLRERRVEIPILAIHYLRKYAQENHRGDLRLAEETMEYLVLYRWPGNVRQLANEMRRLAALAEKDAVLMPEHLSPALAASRRTLPPSARPLDDTEIVVRLDQPMAAGVAHVERTMILHALKKCGGRLEDTAMMLGLSRKGLYLKRQRYGLDAAETPAAEPCDAGALDATSAGRLFEGV
jgi:DNA-binding NtrC family response regulator